MGQAAVSTRLYERIDFQVWWDVVWNAGWRSLLNQLSEEEQKQFEEIAEVLGDEGAWFNTEVLIAVGGEVNNYCNYSA